MIHALCRIGLVVPIAVVTAPRVAQRPTLLYGHRAIAQPAQRWASFRLLALSPLIHVLVFWMGKSDPFRVMADLFLLLTRDRVAVAGLALAMTLVHPEQAAVVLARYRAMP